MTVIELFEKVRPRDVGDMFEVDVTFKDPDGRGTATPIRYKDGIVIILDLIGTNRCKLGNVRVLTPMKGTGTVVVSAALDYIRASMPHKKYVDLTPKPDNPLDMDRLVNWYRRFGFKGDHNGMSIDIKAKADTDGRYYHG